MEIPALYDFARQQNIEVVPFPLPENKSMSVMSLQGDCVIGMDPGIQDGGAQERVHLGHEIGHCVTGSFYNIYAARDCRQRHENRADKWAIGRLVTADALDDAVAEGCCEIWNLAERFGVTEQFMKKAVCYYVHGNVATELYF